MPFDHFRHPKNNAPMFSEDKPRPDKNYIKNKTVNIQNTPTDDFIKKFDRLVTWQKNMMKSGHIKQPKITIIIDYLDASMHLHILKKISQIFKRADNNKIIMETKLNSIAVGIGSLIAIQGTKNHRKVHPDTIIYLACYPLKGSTPAERNYSKRYREFIIRMYSKYTDLSENTFSVMEKKGQMLISAKESIERNFADKVVVQK